MKMVCGELVVVGIGGVVPGRVRLCINKVECSRCRELAGVLGENRRVLNMVSNWKGIALKGVGYVEAGCRGFEWKVV